MPPHIITRQEAGFLESLVFGNFGLVAGRLGITILVALGSVSLWLFKDKAQDMIERQDKTIAAVKELGHTVTELTTKFSVMQEHTSTEDKRVDEHATSLRSLYDNQSAIDRRLTVLESKSVLSPPSHGK